MDNTKLNDISQNSITLGNYLIERLSKHGIKHIFGVPGDFVLGFYHQLANSKIKVINMCDEQGAGFAADAYARINGLGAVCITYCVGGLKVINPTAEAFAEKSPLIIISGSPGIKERKKNPLLHHKVKDFDTQFKIFEQVTVGAIVLNNPQNAAQEVDRAIDLSLLHKRPVYIEIPRDMVMLPIVLDDHHNKRSINTNARNDNNNYTVLEEALKEIVDIINSSKKPIILAGIEMHRYKLQNELLSIVEKFKIPVASTLSSKSIISELHPMYIGSYEGSMGHDFVKEYIESSDCLILLGAFITDIDIGGRPSKIDQSKSISITSEKISIKYHNYENIKFENLIKEIAKSKEINCREVTFNTSHPPIPDQFLALKDKKITINRLFQCLNSFLKDDMIVLADIGDALFGSTDLVIHRKTEFLSPAYYASMGFAVPASIGSKFANSKLRPIVIVGDGAFQMTGMEISVAVRFNLNPIVIVLNNQGYGTERSILDGNFNDIPIWNYSMIPQVVGGGKGYTIETEEQFKDALNSAEKNIKSFSILDVHIDPQDKSQTLQKFTDNLKRKMH